MTIATTGVEYETVDGRQARGVRTRLKVIETLLDLVGEGDVHPTAQAIAARAGVALRTVYHHFENVEALRRAALELDLSRHYEVLRPVDAHLPLAERIEIVAGQCRRLFEAVTPIRRATLFDQHSSPEMATGIAQRTTTRTNHVTSTFAPELGPDSESRHITDAVVLATSWSAWEYSRTMLERSPAETERIVATALAALLAPHATSNGESSDRSHGARSPI